MASNSSKFNKFKNTTKDNHKVRLFPKSEDASVIPHAGEDLAFQDLGKQGGFGFCLSGATDEGNGGGICENSTPTATFYYLASKTGSNPPQSEKVTINGVDYTEAVPTFIQLSNGPVTEQQVIALGLDPSQYNISGSMAFTITNKSTEQQFFEYRMNPPDQDAIVVAAVTSNVEVVEGGFNMCLAPAEPVISCDTKRSGFFIKPDLPYNLAGKEEAPITWTVKINGVVQAFKLSAEENVGQYLEVALNNLNGLTAGYESSADVGVDSGVWLRNTTTDNIIIELIPSIHYDKSDCTIYSVDDDTFYDAPLAYDLTKLDMIDVLADCSIRICLAPNGGGQTTGISCVGATPYLNIALFANPNATIGVTGFKFNVDGVDYNMPPPDILEEAPDQSGQTPAQLTQYFKDAGAIDEAWSYAFGGTFQNITNASHIIKIHLLPENQDMYKYLIYAPWSTEYYPDGGAGTCIGPGSPVIKPEPISCVDSTTGVYIKFPKPLDSYNTGEYWLTYEDDMGGTNNCLLYTSPSPRDRG